MTKMTVKKLATSEFGRGLVICLVKFAEHRWRWQEQKRAYEDLRKKGFASFSESRVIEMHFNGASAHLYEIEVPAEWENTEIDKKAKELRYFGLKMRHALIHETWTEDDVTRAYDLCQEIALLIDKEIGLKPAQGSG